MALSAALWRPTSWHTAVSRPHVTHDRCVDAFHLRRITGPPPWRVAVPEHLSATPGPGGSVHRGRPALPTRTPPAARSDQAQHIRRGLDAQSPSDKDVHAVARAPASSDGSGPALVSGAGRPRPQ
jgi:hypothetical protein